MRIQITVLAIVAVLQVSPGVAAAAPKPYCDDLKGTVTGQICQIQMSDPAYTVNINLPSFYPDQKTLGTYLIKVRDEFLNTAKSSTPRDAPYQLEIASTSYESAVPPRGTQSLVLKVFQNVGGAHPTTAYQAFNWDQGYRKPITYDTLWRPDTDPLKIVFPIVQRELQKQTGQQMPMVPSASLDAMNYQNFAITNDGITFFFSQGELLPEAAGATQASVPRSAIDPLLA